MTNNKPFLVLATGSRTWPREGLDLTESVLIMLKNRYATSGRLPMVMHGGAEGFDDMVETLCKKLHIPTEIWLPEYNRFGKRAPLIRNDEMIQEAPDLVLVGLHGNPTHSGTLYTMRKAQEAGLTILMLNLQVSAKPEVGRPFPFGV